METRLSAKRDWAQYSIRSFYDNKLNLVPNAWRLVGRLRTVASKYTQVEFLISSLQHDLSTAQAILEQNRPYENLFSPEPATQQQAILVIQELRQIEERLVLWHEDFYIHTCILLDCLAELVYWSLPHESRKRLQYNNFGVFYNSLFSSRQAELQDILTLFEPISPIYQNTLKPLRDKVIIHHRPPASSIMTYAGYKLILVDEFRPDRLKLIEQIRKSDNYESNISTAPEDEISLLSQLVAEGNSQVNDYLDKLGVVGVQLPDPILLWAKISDFCINIGDGFAMIAKMHQNPQSDSVEHLSSD